MTDGGGALRAGLAQPHGLIDRTSSWSAPTRLFIEDRDAYRAFPTDRWVYNRLELAQRLGYPCGPAGVPFPWEGTWFAKAIINLRGMSRAARKVAHPADVPDGWFWMPCFSGPHVSVNYDRSNLGEMPRIPSADTPTPPQARWSAWRVIEALHLIADRDGLPVAWIKTSEVPLLPSVFTEHLTETQQLNVEYIGEHVIEAHLRWGWDFAACPDAVAALVVWQDDPQLPPDGPGFISDVAEANGRRRLGFYYVT